MTQSSLFVGVCKVLQADNEAPFYFFGSDGNFDDWNNPTTFLIEGNPRFTFTCDDWNEKQSKKWKEFFECHLLPLPPEQPHPEAKTLCIKTLFIGKTMEKNI